MSYQLESERLAYEFMLERFKQKGDTKMVQRLERAPVTTTGGTPDGYLALRDKGMHSLGIGTTRDMKSVIRRHFHPIMAGQRIQSGRKDQHMVGQIILA